MEDFVTVATYGSPAEAAVMKGKLEFNDIFCYLADEHTIGANMMYSIALGGVKLRVREEDSERALEILNDSSDEIKTELIVEDGDATCPTCNSNNTSTHQQVRWWTLLISFLLAGAAPVPIAGKRHHCFNCGHEWE